MFLAGRGGALTSYNHAPNPRVVFKIKEKIWPVKKIIPGYTEYKGTAFANLVYI